MLYSARSGVNCECTSNFAKVEGKVVRLDPSVDAV